MVQESYVSLEVAKLLKEKGYSQSTDYHHYKKGINGEFYECFNNKCGFGDDDIIAPTQQKAMRWLREVHGIHLNIIFNRIFDKCYWEEGHWTWSNIEYNSYEEACEAAIKYCLENLIV